MKTKNSKNAQLSNAQIEVLRLGVHCKLSRSSMGWSYDDRLLPTEPVRIYSNATISSLLKRGLLDSNFNDLRGVGPSEEARLVENLDGARHTHAPEVRALMVWTSALGRKVLQENGLLQPQHNLAYH